MSVSVHGGQLVALVPVEVFPHSPFIYFLRGPALEC